MCTKQKNDRWNSQPSGRRRETLPMHKTCRRAVILPLHNISSTTKMTKQTAEDRTFLIDKTNAHNNTAGETVSTALFDFSITDVSLVESYPGIDIPDGECLVRMRLNIKNTSSQTYTMFLQDFQIQWGEGDSDYGTCLNAVDDTMMPYAYELTPGQERSDWLMAEIPDGSTSCTIAYQEYKTDGSKGDAYFVEAAL